MSDVFSWLPVSLSMSLSHLLTQESTDQSYDPNNCVERQRREGSSEIHHFRSVILSLLYCVSLPALVSYAMHAARCEGHTIAWRWSTTLTRDRRTDKVVEIKEIEATVNRRRRRSWQEEVGRRKTKKELNANCTFVCRPFRIDLIHSNPLGLPGASPFFSRSDPSNFLFCFSNVWLHHRSFSKWGRPSMKREDNLEFVRTGYLLFTMVFSPPPKQTINTERNRKTFQVRVRSASFSSG